MFPPQARKMPTRNITPIPPCTPRGTIAFILRRTALVCDGRLGIPVARSRRSTAEVEPRPHPSPPPNPPPTPPTKNLRCLTSPLQRRAGAAEMQSSPPSVHSHIAVARHHHHPHPRRSLIVDCCFRRLRPCHHRRWRRCARPQQPKTIPPRRTMGSNCCCRCRHVHVIIVPPPSRPSTVILQHMS